MIQRTRKGRGIVAALTLSIMCGTAIAAEGPITIVLPEQPANLEPCRSIRSDIGQVVNMNITETLTIIQPEQGTVEPHLAQSWEQVDDLTWRFKLREGVKFQDGSDFNAEAVVYSVKRLMNPALTCDSRSKFGDVTLTLTAVDAFTVQIVSSQPIPIMPTLVGTVQIVSPKTPMDSETNSPAGTGPYIINAVGNESIVLDRWDGYWGDKPDVTKVTYVWRGESAIRAAMVSTGEADLTPAIAVQDATDANTDFAYLNSETTRMRIDAQVPPLNDVRIRKALNLAIDWEGMGSALFGDDVIRAAQMVVPGIVGHNDKIEPYKYDPEQAKALVEEARADGVPVDTEITLIGRNNWFPNASESLEAMMAMWEEAGFKMKIEQYEASDWVRYLDKPFPEGIGPTLFMHQHDNNTGDASFTAPVMYTSNGQYSTVAVPALDEVIGKAMSATGDERATLFQQAFAMVHEDVIADVPMYHMIGYVRVGPRIDWKPDLKTTLEVRVSQIKVR